MIFDALKKVLVGSNDDAVEAIKNGATLIDVRSSGEFAGGSADGAINIPHDELKKFEAKLKKSKQPFVVFCASGMRSANAKSQLKAMGYDNVINGKTWGAVQRMVAQ